MTSINDARRSADVYLFERKAGSDVWSVGWVSFDGDEGGVIASDVGQRANARRIAAETAEERGWKFVGGDDAQR